MQDTEGSTRPMKRQKSSSQATAFNATSDVIDLSNDDDINTDCDHDLSTPICIKLHGSTSGGGAFRRQTHQACPADQRWQGSKCAHKQHSAQQLVAEAKQSCRKRTENFGDVVHPKENNLVHEVRMTNGRRHSVASSQAACPQLQSAHQIPKADASSTLSGGYIDLVGVSAAYSGALKAATHHVEDASSDTALAKALAEKADLERQLKEALANKQASHPSKPLRAPMPSHWAPMPDDAHVTYVELPLPPGCSPGTFGHIANPDPPALDQATVETMIYQGLSRKDAEAALRHCQGDGDAAMLHALKCMDAGGAAVCAQRRMALESGSAKALAEAAAQQACQEADLQEAQQVLTRFTANNSSLHLSNVVRIERVQNPHLWTKYCLRRHEVELAAGSAHINEQFLFHGCKDIMAVIANEEFDIRVAGMQGSLGAGTYFAGNSNYSMSYVDKGPGMIGVPGMPLVNANGFFGAQPGMPGFQNMPFVQPIQAGTSWPPGAGTALAHRAGAASILPHPSNRGVATKHRGKQKRKGKSQPMPRGDREEEASPSKPMFLPEGKAMLVCRVALGRLGVGGPGLRLPPKGTDAVTCHGGIVFPQALAAAIFAVFDNSQAYPEYIVHFKTQ
ncbi:TPA: hypothetical protein ACH3X2_002382 [Trebouxia sp. C0005]